MTDAFADFHFLRPLWLALLVPWAYLLYRLWHHDATRAFWDRVCDPVLLPFVVENRGGRLRRRRLLPFALGGLLTIFALAGPTYQRLPQPVFRDQAGLVILLDLSTSMNAADTPPNRLERARFKIKDLLALRRGGQTALVAFAAQPFTVTPLTDDVSTIASQLSILTPALMPRQGTDIPRAIGKGLQLLQQAGFAAGDLLLITDGVEQAQIEPAIKALGTPGFRLSVLGIGTTAGAPIPRPEGGFVSADDGGMVLAKLSPELLGQLAQRGRGLYQSLAVNSADITTFTEFFKGSQQRDSATATDQVANRWLEIGPWLLLPVLVCGSLAFRRGLVLLAVLLLSAEPRGVHADWWSTPDQAAQRAYQHGDFANAAKNFSRADWRAAAQYREGQYEDAVRTLKHAETPATLYNKGNALARLGRFEDAIGAYDQVLKANPSDDDAAHNRELLQKLINQQHPDDKPQDQAGQDPQKKRQQQPPNKNRGEGDEGEQQSKQSGRDTQIKPPAPSDDQATAEREQSQQDKDAQQAARSSQQNGAAASQKDAKDAPKREAKTQNQADGEAEKKLATEQWLRQIPDDPGGLLRRKFQYQYSKTYRDEPESKTPW